MSEEENDYVYTPPQQQQQALVSEGDTVRCVNKDSVNFGIWGEVVEITEVDGVSIAAIKIGNPEFPKQTGWVVKEQIDSLEMA